MRSLPALLLCAVAFVPAIRADEQVADLRRTEARAFVELLVKGQFAEAVTSFDSTMARGLPAEKLAGAWMQVAATGAFQKITEVRVEKVLTYDVVYVRCLFGKTPIDVKVVYHGSDRIAGLYFVPVRPAQLYRLPAYADSTRYVERRITVGTGRWLLHGTLTVPIGEGPFPCLVLVHGSGPEDRDETIGPNKPFRDLAAGLASRGVAVLRYEKRTREHAAEMVAERDTLTVFSETIDDAVAALAAARAEHGVDPHRVFLCGHSLGATLAPRIARIDTATAGIIMLAPSGRPFEDVVVDQMTYILGLGPHTDSAAAILAQVRAAAARVKDPHLSPSTSSSELPLGINASYWLDLRGYDAPRVAATIAKPMLVLFGGRDYQVTAADAAPWRRTVGARRNVTLRVERDCNHLFQSGKGKATPAEYEREGHVEKKVIDEIARWVAGVEKR